MWCVWKERDVSWIKLIICPLQNHANYWIWNCQWSIGLTDLNNVTSSDSSSMFTPNYSWPHKNLHGYVLTLYVLNANLHFYLLPTLLIVYRPCFIINVYAMSVKSALNKVQVWQPTRTVLSVQVCQHVSWITSGLWKAECSIFGHMGSMNSSFGLNFGGWDRAMLYLMSWPFVCLLTLERMRVSASTASRSCPG